MGQKERPTQQVRWALFNDMFVDYIGFTDSHIERQRYPEYIEDFHLCEDCVKKINSEFKIPVKKIDI